MAKRAHIHHRDGNPLNNPPDGSNWEVLCPRCHKQIPGTMGEGSGVSIHVAFAPWKRAAIVADRGAHCERCGVKVSLQRLKREGRLSMAKGQKFVIVDGYTSDLLQRIVNRGMATDLPDAVTRSAASYLGIRYKPKDERKLEQELADVMELGERATKEE